jgi:hypothetical protein
MHGDEIVDDGIGIGDAGERAAANALLDDVAEAAMPGCAADAETRREYHSLRFWITIIATSLLSFSPHCCDYGPRPKSKEGRYGYVQPA